MRSLNHSIVICLIFFIITDTIAAEPTSYLPVTHRVYDFIERMEHYYFLTGTHLGLKPMTRADVANLLFGMMGMRDALSETDRDEYRCLCDEFKVDLTEHSGIVWDDKGPVERLPSFLQNFLYRNRRNLFSKQGDSFTLYCDPVIVRKAVIGKERGTSKDDNVFTSSNGLVFHGAIGENVGFFIDVRDSKEWGSQDYPANTSTTLPGRGFASFKGDHAEFDETNAHIAYSTDYFAIMYGRGKTLWGRGNQGTFALSGNASPYDMVSLETGFWKIKYSFFAAELKQYPPIASWYYESVPGVTSDSVTVKKYLSGHRLDIEVNTKLSLGFYETVVYGGRWEMSYLNPVMFLKGGEHYNGDHDNAAMGMDFRLFIHRYHSFYGEVFIDDITTTKLGTDWYGNKLAFQLGTFIVNPFGFRDFDARIEYTRINPWVYTHHYPINSYTHYGDVLGHSLGPNADDLFVELRKRFSRRFHTSVSWWNQRHGANITQGGANPILVTNVGGDPSIGFRDGDSKHAKFLAGNREKTTAISFDLSYELCWQLFIKAGYTHEIYNGYGNNAYRLSLGLNE